VNLRRGPQLPYRLVAGVVPARGRWLIASAKVAGGTFAPETPRLHDTFLEILSETPQLDTIVISAPIGHPNVPLRGLRACDREAQALLGPRGGAIVPVVSRDVIAATDRWVEGLDVVTSAQLPRFRQVAEEMSPFRQRTVYEGRAELSFMQLNNGQPMRYAKSRDEGVVERRELLLAKLNGVDRLIDAELPGVAPHALLDAAVLVWTARRVFTHAARRIPFEPEWDSEGLRMEFVV